MGRSSPPKDFIMLSLAALAASFTAPGVHRVGSMQRAACADMSALKISAIDFELSEALKEYADTKLAKPIETFGSLLNGEPELHMKVESRGVHDAEHKGKEAHIAEITAFCVEKHVITAKAENEDMYASLDELTDTLTRSLRKYKEKRVDMKEGRKRARKGELDDTMIEEEEEEEEIAAS